MILRLGLVIFFLTGRKCARYPPVALASKNVRIAWAVLSRGEDCHGSRVFG